MDETFSSADRKFTANLIEETSKYYNDVHLDVSEPNLANFVVKQLESFGLETYQQNFTVALPVRGSGLFLFFISLMFKYVCIVGKAFHILNLYLF